MSEEIERRQFLVRMWQAGGALIAAAAAWTSWDLLQPLASSGFGGLVRTLSPEAVPEAGVVEVPAARSYLTRIEGEVVALSEKCTHLGCRVPFCESSGQFECPCHGTVFNRAGDWITGPAPRGMDRYPTELGEDGLLYIDTGGRLDGPQPGSLQIDEPPTGPSCATESHS
jgi:cytochrome b6-f complex iron-sulfur subunit